MGELVEFVKPLLKSTGSEMLKKSVCRTASMENRTKRTQLREFAEYVDSVIAPLVFLPYEGIDGSCSTEQATYRLSNFCIQQELRTGVDGLIAQFRQEHGPA